MLSPLYAGCSLQEDFSYQGQADIVTVSGLLHPDSLIEIRVGKAAPYPSTAHPLPIEEASVSLYEDGILLPALSYSPERKSYRLSYYPKAGSSYRLLVGVEGYGELSASTSIPQKAALKACYQPFPRGETIDLNGKVKLSVEFASEPSSRYYVGVLSKQFKRERIETFPYQRTDSSIIETRFVNTINSSSTLIDPFNGLNDMGHASYRFYLRLLPLSGIERYTLDLYSLDTDRFFTYEQLLTLSDTLGLFVQVHSVSEDYDQYMKSSLVDFLNKYSEGGLPNPFAESIPTYSNISGGSGIFAGYNTTTLPVENSPCQ
jgi:hypothetical protein